MRGRHHRHAAERRRPFDGRTAGEKRREIPAVVFIGAEGEHVRPRRECNTTRQHAIVQAVDAECVASGEHSVSRMIVEHDGEVAAQSRDVGTLGRPRLQHTPEIRG